MIRKLSLAILATAALAGCVTGYGYRGGSGDYYYGRPSASYDAYYGSPYAYYGQGGLGFGYGFAYGSPYRYRGGYYGYPYYGYPFYGYPFYYYGHRHHPRPPHGHRPPPRDEDDGGPRYRVVPPGERQVGREYPSRLRQVPNLPERRPGIGQPDGPVPRVHDRLPPRTPPPAQGGLVSGPREVVPPPARPAPAVRQPDMARPSRPEIRTRDETSERRDRLP